MAALRAGPDNFLKPNATIVQQWVPVRASAGAAQPVTLVFRNLPTDRHALTAFQDEYGSGMMDKNLFAPPTEPFGFGNVAFGSFEASSTLGALLPPLRCGRRQGDHPACWHLIVGPAMQFAAGEMLANTTPLLEKERGARAFNLAMNRLDPRLLHRPSAGA